MNIRELKRRLLPYSGYMKPDEDGSSGTGNATQEEALDLGNDDQPSSGTSETAAPAPASAPSAAAASDAGAGEGAGATQNVPYARFREVNENRRLLEEQLAAAQKEVQALKAGQQPAAAPAAAAAPAPVAFDVDAAEEQYAQALLDGDAKGAGAIRREINQHIENSVMQRFEQTSQQQQAAAKSQDVVASALQAYPWLDQDEGAVALELIEASVKAKTATGMPRHLALADAISTIAPRFAPDGTPSKGLPDGGAPADTRLERADKRGAADSLLQPAAVQAGMGNRATASKIDATKTLTDEQITGSSKAELDSALGLA
ncbi:MULTISPECIES: hypothetical protein [unclassified Acidovorax]|uniref:hypothetical protein n=1 Tax=unclassified Acidovorax TaxID=2684926 RepID=UPI0028832C6B|nr:MULTISPECIES: hypothetical protein [unclassified Acidovorax]